MKKIGYRWFFIAAPAFSILAIAGCHEDGDEVDGVLAIISGVFELVLGIIAVSS